MISTIYYIMNSITNNFYQAAEIKAFSGLHELKNTIYM